MPAPAVSTSTVIGVLRDGAWDDPGEFTLSYSVPTASSIWGPPTPPERSEPGYGVLSAAQGDAFRAAMELWDSYVAWDFHEVADDGSGYGQIRVAFTTTPAGVGAYAGLPSNGSAADTLTADGDIWISSSASGVDFAQGTADFYALLHEIGHALGLDHAHNDTPGGGGSDFLPAEYDNVRYSVMSYNGIDDHLVYDWIPGPVPAFPIGGGHSAVVLTPMLFDIVVIQDMYGASTTTNAGATTYTFDPDAATLQTIYDSGGVDTFDLTGHERPSIIDLNAASFSSIDYYSIEALIDDTVAIYDESWRSFITDHYNGASNVFTWSNNVAIAYGVTIENVLLGEGDDSVIGNDAANDLRGNGGDDILDGGAGADTMFGGNGDDTYHVDNSGDVTTEGSALGGTDTVIATVTRTLTANIENLTLAAGAGAITGNGNAIANTITGNEAANGLFGFDGADTLDGGAGADSMFGGNGDDIYFVDNAGDQTTEVSALGGADTVFSSVNRNLTAHIEHLTLLGAAVTGAGNSLNNGIAGNEMANTLYGFAGDDVLNGNIGADTLFGANGDDTYIVDNAGDITVEGSALGGTDTVQSSVSRNLNANFENLMLLGTAQFGYGNVLGNQITGNASANGLYGLDGNDTLNGGAGIDQMFGANGDDTYIVDNAADVTSEVSALGGTDTVQSSVTRNLTAHLENLVLTGTDAINGAGNALANVITGNSGVNTLFGLDGADTLDGGLGADVLQGGAGADSYVFSSALGAGNIDAINGFNVADDTISLDAAVFAGLGAGALAAGAFRIGAAAADADDRIIYNNATGGLFFDADGNGAGAAVQFATLTAGLALTSADFIVFGP